LRETVDLPTTQTSKEAHRKKEKMKKMRKKKNFENGWTIPTVVPLEET